MKAAREHVGGWGLLLRIALAFSLGVGPAAAEGCRGVAVPGGAVRAALDGRTVVLEDGRLVRLAGLAGEEVAAAAGLAQAYLRADLVGRAVTLAAPGQETDRHGRVEAFLRADEGLEPSIQHVMVSRGLARVAVRAGDRACAAGLLSREEQARKARRGLWADPANGIRQADDPAAILRLRGKFVLVEGRVLSVRESGGTIYVNFGRRWLEDFTATIAKRNERGLTAAGFSPKSLERRVVRIRGWVEERGGPWIEVVRPDQVEMVGN